MNWTESNTVGDPSERSDVALPNPSLKWATNWGSNIQMPRLMWWGDVSNYNTQSESVSNLKVLLNSEPYIGFKA